MTDTNQQKNRPIAIPIATLEPAQVPSNHAQLSIFREPTNTQFRVLVPSVRKGSW